MAKSEYLQREEAAKKQLGAKGVKKRVKQLPTAARASLREMTGIDVSRKGVSVDPGNVALAAAGFIPFGKSLSVAAKVLKPVGMRIAGAAGRVAAKSKRSVKMASSEIENAKWMDSQAAEMYEKAYREKNRSLGGFSNRYESKGRGAFDEDLGYNLSRVSSGVSQNEGERLVRQGLARKVYSGGGDSVEYFSTGGDALSKEAARISSLSSSQRAVAEATLRAAGSRANKQAAAAEIKRRLAALKAAKKRPSAPRNPKIPSAL